ncbi:MAG: GNAT family N-acetyltransferase [Acutalibacteraceae bacterium]|nr:GNAT family N-acetyltransferase [Clostridia bacterium]MEE3449153.1 GNAT family N-acetyltransferase [Acutalibacteraceae bacterium]
MSEIMNLNVRPMTIDDYDEVFAMWQITTKRALSEADSRENIAFYLKRNPQMSQVAVADGKIVGTVLCGHDGRRGFIHHMAVMPEYRRHSIAKSMAQKAIDALLKDGIAKTHIFCYTNNSLGQSFWTALGWQKREEVFVYSFNNLENLKK